MTCRLPFLLLPLALVTACNDSADSDRRTASGEVLDGTISDAMLPLDTVQSQPPLMKSEVKKAAPEAAAAPAEEAAAPDVPTEAPAPTPSD